MIDFRELAALWLAPGRVYAFVGSGGKSTGMRTLSRILSARGLRVRMTTTTRMGAEEFSAYPLLPAGDTAGFDAAMESPAREAVIGAAAPAGSEKILGVDPGLIEEADIPSDCVLLAECDGSRRLPMKAPKEHEPVVPRNAAAMFAVMGASAFGESISEATCYNRGGALALLGAGEGVFDAPALALLATHPRGYRKGVPARASYRLLVNQGDLPERRPIARALLRELGGSRGIPAVLLSWREERVYDGAGDPVFGCGSAALGGGGAGC